MERDRLAEITRGAHAVIDLDAYEGNIRLIHRIAGLDRRMMAIVKANAYGHGAVACAAAAIDAGCSYLGVARIDEAVELRDAGITAPILIVGPPNTNQIEIAIERGIALTVATLASAAAVIHAARRTGRRAVAHVKIDTGLHRYGALPDLALEITKLLDGDPNVELEGVFTHFSSADEDDPSPTLAQIELFNSTLDRLETAGVRPHLVHLANSAAVLTGQLSRTNMVRAGIATYGLDPSDETPAPSEMKQVLTIRSVLTRRFTLATGESVSYNRTFTAPEDVAAAAVPIGYADGIERHLSNRGWFIHRGQRCPILGRVCMDQTVIRVPDNAREGDAVTIIGPGDDGEMTVRDLARLCRTNTYEPVTRLAARVPRIYTRGGVPVSWSVPMLGERGVLPAE